MIHHGMWQDTNHQIVVAVIRSPTKKKRTKSSVGESCLDDRWQLSKISISIDDVVIDILPRFSSSSKRQVTYRFHFFDLWICFVLNWLWKCWEAIKGPKVQIGRWVAIHFVPASKGRLDSVAYLCVCLSPGRCFFSSSTGLAKNVWMVDVPLSSSRRRGRGGGGRCTARFLMLPGCNLMPSEPSRPPRAPPSEKSKMAGWEVKKKKKMGTFPRVYPENIYIYLYILFFFIYFPIHWPQL